MATLLKTIQARLWVPQTGKQTIWLMVIRTLKPTEITYQKRRKLFTSS